MWFTDVEAEGLGRKATGLVTINVHNRPQGIGLRF